MTFLSVVNLLTMALVIANVVFSIRARKRFYRAGWLAGRGAMVESLIKALRDGISLEVWLASEAISDGLKVHGLGEAGEQG